MSCQRGNTSRTRSQKYQNKTKFKNNLHNTNDLVKKLNNIDFSNVCSRCKEILEWKINYNKYKLLKNPSTCVNCRCKNVKHAYHILCNECALERNVCPKCGEEKKLEKTYSQFNPQEMLKSGEFRSLMDALSERHRRKINRLVERADINDLCSEEKLLEKLKSLQLCSSAVCGED